MRAHDRGQEYGCVQEAASEGTVTPAEAGVQGGRFRARILTQSFVSLCDTPKPENDPSPALLRRAPSPQGEGWRHSSPTLSRRGEGVGAFDYYPLPRGKRAGIFGSYPLPVGEGGPRPAFFPKPRQHGAPAGAGRVRGPSPEFSERTLAPRPRTICRDKRLAVAVLVCSLLAIWQAPAFGKGFAGIRSFNVGTSPRSVADGDGTFQAATGFSAGTSPLAAGDLNNDGNVAGSPRSFDIRIVPVVNSLAQALHRPLKARG